MKTYPKCPCGKLARIIFYCARDKKVVDWCWECFDGAGGLKAGRE